MSEPPRDGIRVHETFFVLLVSDMARAVAFYENALGGAVSYMSDAWTSVTVSGVRLGLSHAPGHIPCETQLHFAVADLSQACERVTDLGGSVVHPPRQLAKEVWLARVRDPEGNAFSFSGLS
ncbi:MAG: VOC family protein [Sandaracinaceae bacterium]